VLIEAALRSAAVSLGAPIGTLPFCFAALIVMLTQDKVPHFEPVPLSDVATAEDHLHSARVQRLHISSSSDEIAISSDGEGTAAKDSAPPSPRDCGTVVGTTEGGGGAGAAGGGGAARGGSAAARIALVLPPSRCVTCPATPSTSACHSPATRPRVISRGASRSASRGASRNTSVHAGDAAASAGFLSGVLHGGSLHAENHVARRLAAFSVAVASLGGSKVGGRNEYLPKPQPINPEQSSHPPSLSIHAPTRPSFHPLLHLSKEGTQYGAEAFSETFSPLLAEEAEAKADAEADAEVGAEIDTAMMPARHSVETGADTKV